MERIEQTVRRKNEKDLAKDKFKYKMYFGLALVLFAYALVALCVLFASISAGKNVTVSGFIPILVTAGIGAILIIKKDSALTEYDYAVEDDIFTVAKIFNLKTRKEIFSLPVRNFKRIEKYSKERFASLNVKKYDFALNGEDEKYILFCSDGSEQKAVAIEPNEKFLFEIQRELKK